MNLKVRITLKFLIQLGVLFALVCGIGIAFGIYVSRVLASMMSGLEHEGNMWKQLIALPISRVRLYLSKFVWLAGFLACSGALCAIGTVILGLALGFGTHVPWMTVLQEGFYPYLAAYALISIQLLLSILVSNQSIAITLGVIGVIAGIAAHVIPFWVPWVYPVLATPLQLNNPIHYVVYGLAAGLVILCFGASLFVRREVR